MSPILILVAIVIFLVILGAAYRFIGSMPEPTPANPYSAPIKYGLLLIVAGVLCYMLWQAITTGHIRVT